MSYSGIFRPKNPRKYKGDPRNIIYRSLWELRLMTYLDHHPDVILWASEEFCVPYRSPVDGRLHRYFPDFWVKQRNKTGEIVVKVLEVKPLIQTQPPAPRARTTKRYINEVMTWGVNQAKWEAAKKYCKQRGWEFTLITEKELGISA